MKKTFTIFIAFVLLVFLVGGYLSLKKPVGVSEEIKWGVAFSKIFAEEMGLDWRDVYLAMLNDIRPEYIRLPVYWSDVEPEEEVFEFSDYDWMINEASMRGVKIILVIGRKLPRWPECHEPEWAAGKDEVIKAEKIKIYMKKTVLRYRDLPNLTAWQVENEPFLPFGECPTISAEVLDDEVVLVKTLDGSHPIIITDSGELSVWLGAYKRADIFGTTMYRIIWDDFIGYVKYPLPPKFFWLKANIARLFYGEKPIIVSELQTEPWGPNMPHEMDLDEQFRSMNINRFHDNINYARAVGFPEVYLWGAEWWYWMKEKQDHPEFWEAAEKLFKNKFKNG